MATGPVTQQIVRNQQGTQKPPANVHLSDVEDCLVYDRYGNGIPFGRLYQDKTSIIVFVKNFLCYTCKEYVEDLAKIPKKSLLSADVRLVLIGQSSHCHIEIYTTLGMRRGEAFAESASPSPHVRSSMLRGTVGSLWRAMRSPAFDFQGDPLQQGGAIIAGPGSEVHFAHFDMNRLDHMPINWLLQLAGVETVDFSDQPKIIHV
ncbi:peroxiredoxin-like 2C isoform X2 [Anguilla anguilla]|uniref:peroxiredoxin-like 2C isoform X2 n=1 Tax=Anguilla anguilla TaxID=7936 RepID=UPI0015A9D6C0|nr:peroxiredoxin-like 2C isoform X2 [Anguilla anguilla]